MDFPSWIGQIVLGAGGGAAVAVALVKFFGEKWIKHTLDKDLEFVKAEISYHAAKRVRLHDKEYEVFPLIWKKLIVANNRLSSALMEFRQVPDFGRMDKQELASWVEFLDDEKFTPDEKAALQEATDTSDAFNRLLDRKNLNSADESYQDFDACFQANRIFLNPEVRDKLGSIGSSLRKAWAARATDLRLSGREDFLEKAMKIQNEEIQPLIIEIENLMQFKLFPDQES